MDWRKKTELDFRRRGVARSGKLRLPGSALSESLLDGKRTLYSRTSSGYFPHFAFAGNSNIYRRIAYQSGKKPNRQAKQYFWMVKIKWCAGRYWRSEKRLIRLSHRQWKNPWWQVDLGEVKNLTEIRIFNRLDYCADRARTIQVLLSNDGSNWTRVFANDGSIFGGNDGNPLSVSLKGKSARYVRLQLTETNYFHLDEVEIYW